MFCLRFGIVLSVLATAQSLQCRDADGKSVDWFAMYKMPKFSHSTVHLVKDGLAAMYLDGSNPSWTESSSPINGSKLALYQTLAPLYGSSLGDDVMVIMYNDQLPNGTHSTYHGHTKGVVAFDKTGGFWLVHSVPCFPSQPSQGYMWPDDEFQMFGQSFLCISFPLQALANISRQLYYNYPYVYVQRVPPAFQTRFPLLAKVGHGHPTSAPWTSSRPLTSSKGTKFWSFAKFTKFNADLYDGFVAPALKSSLLVETWKRGRGNLDNNCSAPYKVMTVDDVRIDGGQGIVTFSNEFDHAKWAVSPSQGQGGWVCIGDINRQKAQFKRAGGTVCFQNPGVWQSYFKSVSNYTHCPGNGV